MRLIITLFFLSVILNPNLIQAEEYLLFDLDLHLWKLAFKNSNPQASLVEFILKEESLQNWTEMVTVQKIPASLNTVGQIYSDFMKGLLSIGPIQSRVISLKEGALLFEWWILDSPFAQHEWFKIIKTPRSIMTLRYTTKKMDQVEQVRSVWEEILEDSIVWFDDLP